MLGAFWALLCWQRHLSRQSASGVHDLRETRRRQAPTPHRLVREPTSDGYDSWVSVPNMNVRESQSELN